MQLYITSLDFDGLVAPELLDEIFIEVPSGTGINSPPQTYFGDHGAASLELSYALTCIQPNYFGPTCSVLCIPQDNELGHYSCNTTTGAKECLPGYYDPDTNCTCTASEMICNGQSINPDTGSNIGIGFGSTTTSTGHTSTSTVTIVPTTSTGHTSTSTVTIVPTTSTGHTSTSTVTIVPTRSMNKETSTSTVISTVSHHAAPSSTLIMHTTSSSQSSSSPQQENTPTATNMNLGGANTIEPSIGISVEPTVPTAISNGNINTSSKLSYIANNCNIHYFLNSRISLDTHHCC